MKATNPREMKIFVSERQKMTEKSRLSKILLGNEHWDLFYGVPKGFNLRTRVRIKLETSLLGYHWDMFQTTISLIACMVCIAQSYHDEFDFPWLDMIFGVIFGLDYILRFYCAKNRLIFPFTLNAIVDALAIAPAVYDHFIRSPEHTGQSPTFAFLRFIRVLRIMKVIQVSRHNTAVYHISAVQQQLLSLGLLVTSIVFISACLFQLVENAYREPVLFEGNLIDNSISLGDSFYFILVTISTVGYGDISPSTTVGKFVTCAMILMSLVMLPQEVNRLIALLSMQSPFRKTYVPNLGHPHVLLLGYVSNANILLDFFTEFYHPDRIICMVNGTSTVNTFPCVIMSQLEPTEEIRALLVNPILQNKVVYIKGSILNDEDLHRVAVDEAQAAFILTDKNTNDSVAEDANTVLRSLVLENCNPELQVFMQVINPSYSDFVTQNDYHHILCIDQHKLSLLAKNCLCPGLSTLVCNLFRSQHLPPILPPFEWKREYIEGSTMEIYTTATPSYLIDLSFTKAADLLYDIYGGELILLGVHEGQVDIKPATGEPQGLLKTLKSISTKFITEETSRTNRAYRHLSQPSLLSNQSTYVNPGSNYILRPHHILYVLCESRNVAQSVSSPEHYNIWIRQGNSLKRPSKEHRYSQPYDLLQENSRLVSTRDALARKREEVFLDGVAPPIPPDPATESNDLPPSSVSNHIIVVSDLVDVPIETFIKPLRLAHYTEGSKNYRQILFVSMNSAALEIAYDVAKHYEGVYLMRAGSDSKETFFQAGVLTAKSCVLLAEKSAQRMIDGESLDSRVIFRYMTVQKIIEKHSSIMNEDFAVFVEMAASSTMKVMDTTLTRRMMVENPMQYTTSRPSQGMHRREPGRKSFIETVNESRKTAKRRHQHLKYLRKKRGDGMPDVLPFYSAGYGVPTDFFDSLLSQCFFTPELLRFAQELLCMEQRPHASGSIVSSSLNQIPLPDTFVGKCFGDLFSYILMYESVIGIGLYRIPIEGSDMTVPYVYTLPKRNTVLRFNDYVFVLAQPHTQITLENTMNFEASVVESRIKNMHITKTAIQNTLHKIKLDKENKEGEVLPVIEIPKDN